MNQRPEESDGPIPIRNAYQETLVYFQLPAILRMKGPGISSTEENLRGLIREELDRDTVAEAVEPTEKP